MQSSNHSNHSNHSPICPACRSLSSNQAPSVQPMPPMQCTCRSVLQEQDELISSAHTMQEQLQHQYIFQPMYDDHNVNACEQGCTAYQNFTPSGSCVKPSAIARHYDTPAYDMPAQRYSPMDLSCGATCLAAQENSGQQMPPTNAASNYYGNQPNVIEEEYYSLSSGSSDREDAIAPVARKPKCHHSTDNSQSSYGRQVRNHQRSGNSHSFADSRNAAILNLLQEVVHLINQDEESSSACCDVAQTKMRNISTLDSDDSITEQGAFSSGFKVKFKPNRKGTSSNACTDQSESQNVAQCVNIPLQLPCNLIITPNEMSCIPVQQMQAASSSPSCGICAPPSESPCRSPARAVTNYDNQSCMDDIELIEEIAALALKANSKNRPQTCGDQSAFTSTPMNTCADRGDNKLLCTQQCTCNNPCPCPIHGFYEPPVDFQNAVKAIVDCVCPNEGEEHPACEETCIADFMEASKKDHSCRAQVQNDCDGGAQATHCAIEDVKPKKKGGGECDCCHCKAVRQNGGKCTTIATPQQAKNKSNCDELKFFIDSIIMDLDAMEHVRRKKQVEQSVNPTRAKVCPRQSYPVTITEVTDLGTTSLYVKWTIHNCFGIAGYEIFVDGYLTNRYFHCNHEAAVVCDVDVTKPHKIVLVAQPIANETVEEMCAGINKDKPNKCKELLRKEDAEKMEKAQLWTPSIYLYDPSESQKGMSAVNRDPCDCAAPAPQ